MSEMTEDRLELRRKLEPIIKRFRNYTITMRDAMSEIESVFQSQLSELTAENERLKDELELAKGTLRGYSHNPPDAH